MLKISTRSLARIPRRDSESGILSLESFDILKVSPLRDLGTPIEIVSLFGGKQGYLTALRELESALYQEAA